MAPTSEPQHTLELVKAFINAPSIAERRRVVVENPDVLSALADSILAQIIESYAGEPASQQALVSLRTLLRRCRQIGVDAGFASFLNPDAATRRMTAGIRRFVAASDWSECRRIVTETPELLLDEADAAMGRTLDGYADDPAALRTLTHRRQLLQRCREVGVESTFAPLIERETLPPEAAAVLEALATTSATQGVAQRIARCAEALQHVTRDSHPFHWASLQHELGNAWCGRPDGSRADNLERGLRHLSQACGAYVRDRFPSEWGMVQNSLATAYLYRIRGDRAENLEQALRGFAGALAAYPRATYPHQWAAIQNNAANVYKERIRGDRAENLEGAIQHYTGALEVRTRESEPFAWAQSTTNLADTYVLRIRGNRGDNVERAIELYQDALTVRTREAAPAAWARVQSSLGAAYRNRIHGDPGENIELAIEALSLALEVRSREQSPASWAASQTNLANAYGDRLRGARAENLERAIQHHQLALEVLTRDSDPLRWALCKRNLGNAYCMRIRGDRADNLELAVDHIAAALTVMTPEALPQEWAMSQNALAAAYRDRVRGDRAKNVEKAIQSIAPTLETWTREGNPERWAAAQHNLAGAYHERLRGDRGQNLEEAIRRYELALQVYTKEGYPADWARTLNNLANVYRDRVAGDAIQNLAQASACYARAQEVYTLQVYPERWAAIEANLAASGYEALRSGDPKSDFAGALSHWENALSYYTADAWPERHREILQNRGGAHFEQGNWEPASRDLGAALALTQRLYGAALLAEAREKETGHSAVAAAAYVYSLVRMGQPDLAWDALEANRARRLHDGLNRVRARNALAAASDETRGRHTMLREHENDLREALSLPEGDPRRVAYADVMDELRHITTERTGIERELCQSAGIGLEAPGLREALALPLLEDGRTGVLAMAVTEHGTAALLLTRDSLRHMTVQTLTASDVRDLVWGPDRATGIGGYLGAYRRYVGSPTAHRSDVRDEWGSAIEHTVGELGRRLWTPLMPLLDATGIERLALVPQGLLFLLPIHVCPVGGEQLCDRYTVGYTPAVSVLSATTPAETDRSPRTLIIDRPTADLHTRISVLPSLLHEGASVTTIWQNAATPTAVAQALRRADSVYYYGHGEYVWSSPERSGLILVPDGVADAQGPARFTVADTRKALDGARPRLVTLAACETGITEMRRGLSDEYIGLPGAVLQAGAQAVVASLWRVSALATGLLMKRFYEAWRGGEIPIAEALGKAQGWLRASDRREARAELDDLEAKWIALARSSGDPEMAGRAESQSAAIDRARRQLLYMEDPPFEHPYWWAGFQAIGNVM